MNIDGGSNQYSDASGANKQNNQLLLLNGVFNGCGSTDSFIRWSGETYWWILPLVNIDLFNRVLADFAQHFGLGKNKRIILVVDRAGCQTSDQVKVPKGIHLFFLPAYSPELQPAERLWPLTNQPIANRCFESLDELFRCVIPSLSPFTSTTRIDPWFNFLSLVALLCHLDGREVLTTQLISTEL